MQAQIRGSLSVYILPSGQMTKKLRRTNVDATWWRRIDVDTTSFWHQMPTGLLPSASTALINYKVGDSICLVTGQDALLHTHISVDHCPFNNSVSSNERPSKQTKQACKCGLDKMCENKLLIAFTILHTYFSKYSFLDKTLDQLYSQKF